jgi:thiol-disulfide isomerase/thioredoxin
MFLTIYRNQNKNGKVSLINSALIVTMPGCGYCKELEPILQKLNDALKLYNNDGTTKIYNIENEAFKQLVTNSKIHDAVSGYPTILIAKNNKLSKIYDGPRTVDALLKFFKDNLNIKQIKKGGTKRKQSKSKSKSNYSKKHKLFKLFKLFR